MNNTPISIMFLAALRFDGGKSVRGAFLLTDGETKPLEFRCTNPIRPTQLQVMLYGNILNEYILVELIGQPLVKGATTSPTLVLVNDPAFLQLRSKINIPVVLVTKDEKIDTADSKDGFFQMLNSVSGRFDPVVVSVHSDHPNDRELARQTLVEVFNRHNIVEPFERVAVALEQVHVQKVGEASAT